MLKRGRDVPACLTWARTYFGLDPWPSSWGGCCDVHARPRLPAWTRVTVSLSRLLRSSGILGTPNFRLSHISSVVSNLSAERIGENELLWTLHVSDDEDFNKLDVKWEYLFGEDRNLDNQTKTKLTFNTGRLDAVMKGYQDTDDGMLLVTVCENDVPGYSSCNYMNEGSTSIQFELIPHAFSIPIICDGSFCQNDGDLDDDGVKDEYDADHNDPNKSTIYPLALRDNASDNSTPMSGLALWLDASNIDGNNNSSLSDGDAVSVWKDLSGNGNDVVQANNSFSPTLNKVSDIGEVQRTTPLYR